MCWIELGIMIDAGYQITGAAGDVRWSNLSPILMEPYEAGHDPSGSYSHDIGPDPEYADSSKYATTNGTFHDVPVGICSNAAFSNYANFSRDLYDCASS
jgi:hypothetical protein